MSDPPLVLVLGASGYVGGRLVPRLLEAGYRVRCLARTPSKLAGLPWAQRVEIVAGDLLTPETLPSSFAGVDACVHLVHSMGGGHDFAEADRQVARAIATAAAEAGVRRIVYLGGLGEIDEDSSAHLRSRAEVADILRAGPVPVTVLRAAVIIGSGSASFEMLRHLVERLPVMVTPRWVRTRVQPIAIRDVLRYLVGVLDDLTDTADHDYDIGGPDVLSYAEMMQRYAAMAGLRGRLILGVPLLSPRLSSLWVNLVTPVPTGIARPLVDSLTTEVVVRPQGEDITAVVPGECIGYDEALRLALSRVRDAEVETSWREAELTGRSPAEPYPGDPDWSGGTLLHDSREVLVKAPPQAVYAAVTRVGGDRGWPSHMWAWELRGLADRLIGGMGLQRGRRDPLRLRVGDALDFWRVERAEEPEGSSGGCLRLRAEMRLPGEAWLEWSMEASTDPARPGTRLRQRALFAPKGLLGRLYWLMLVPFHGPIFASMLVALAKDAVAIARQGRITSSDEPTALPEARDVSGAARGRRRRLGRRAG